MSEHFPGNIAEAARMIREAMAKGNVAQTCSNVRYWINLKNAAADCLSAT